MLNHINIQDLLYLDIETVPMHPAHHELSENMKMLWAAKHAQLRTDDESAEEGYLKRAGVYAEFAKIVCISMGVLHQDKSTSKRMLRLKSFAGDDEKELLNNFVSLLNIRFNKERYHFCGHNLREFDIPFICRRLLINGIHFPEILNVSGKRPWEMLDVDTLQLWKFGDFKNYTSLKLLAEILGIPTPKGDIEGKDVCRVYWQEKGLQRIVDYCERDVVTVARLLLRFKGDTQGLTDDDVVHA